MNPDLALRLERSSGSAKLSFKTGPSGTTLDDLYQQGCCKVRFPRKYGRTPEAVLLNTAGGLADGDTMTTRLLWRKGTRAIVTTQAAERVYKAAGTDIARVTTGIRVEEDSVACWLPQETIVFDNARVARSLEIDMASTSYLFAVESTVFGRRAMGEIVKQGRIAERWRVRIGGRLVFADNQVIDDRLAGNIGGYLGHPAVANAAHCMATAVIVADECEKIVEGTRRIFAESHVTVGATCLDRLAVVRILADDSRAMREAISRIVTSLGSTFDFELPRVWHC